MGALGACCDVEMIEAGRVLDANEHLEFDFGGLGGFFRDDNVSHDGLESIQSCFELAGSRECVAYLESAMRVGCGSSYLSVSAGTLNFKEHACERFPGALFLDDRTLYRAHDEWLIYLDDDVLGGRLCKIADGGLVLRWVHGDGEKQETD